MARSSSLASKTIPPASPTLNTISVKVHEHNPWLAYGDALQKTREWGAAPKAFDFLDEKALKGARSPQRITTTHPPADARPTLRDFAFFAPCCSLWLHLQCCPCVLPGGAAAQDPRRRRL